MAEKIWFVGGVEMKLPLIVGAGVCKTVRKLCELDALDLPVGALTLGSVTPNFREPNTPGPLSHWIDSLQSGLNAYGMPNDGYTYVAGQLSTLASLRYPLIVSIAGFTPDDYCRGLEVFSDPHLAHVVSAIELNFGCPNVGGKVPLSYDMKALRSTCIACQDWCNKHFSLGKRTVPIWVKLSPYVMAEDLEPISSVVDTSAVIVSERSLFLEAMHIIRSLSDVFCAVSGINTIGNVKYHENGISVTGPNEGKAGLSGALIKQIGMRQVEELFYELPTSVDIVAGGGVLTGDDAADYLELRGNSRRVVGVSMTSLPYWFGPKSLVELFQSDRLLKTLGLHEEE